MGFRLHHTSSFIKIIIILLFILMSYLLYFVTLSIYKNYQIDRHIMVFDEENTRLEDSNKRIEKDISYLNSISYQEKIAKQNFGLVNPGEEVIIVPKTGDKKGQALIDDLTGNSPRQIQTSNPVIWFDLLFGREFNLF